MANAGRLTVVEQRRLKDELVRIEGWIRFDPPRTRAKKEGRVSVIKTLLKRDEEAQARDARKGRWRRTR